MQRALFDHAFPQSAHFKELYEVHQAAIHASGSIVFHLRFHQPIEGIDLPWPRVGFFDFSRFTRTVSQSLFPQPPLAV